MRSGFTVKLALLTACLAFALPPAKAQSGMRPGVYAGADLLKSLWAWGLVAEPTVYGVVHKNWLLSATYGYANMQRDSVYQNLVYRSKGHYVRPGIEFLVPGGHFSLGLGYLYASYHETGLVVFAGPYFGDKQINLSRKMSTRGLEFTANACIPVSKRLFVRVSGRTGTLHSRVRSGNYPEMPPYYAPGAGFILGNQVPGRTGTIGFSVGLVYQLTGQKRPEQPEVLSLKK